MPSSSTASSSSLAVALKLELKLLDDVEGVGLDGEDCVDEGTDEDDDDDNDGDRGSVDPTPPSSWLSPPLEAVVVVRR